SEAATFGGGCFWCTEAVFTRVKGVTGVTSGYAGGHVPYPSYQQVCTGTTGHAEVVRVEYDPEQVSFRQLLAVLLGTHDPTTLNRQGHDVGTQYRSVVFYHDEEQRRAAEEAIREHERQGTFGDPIVTQLEPAGEFYEAEEYHRDYFLRNPAQAYCAAVIAPKVAKFRRSYAHLLKD